MGNKTKAYSLLPIYLLGFLYSLQMALPNYINSSFLGTFISEKSIGFVYALASVFTIIGFLLLPRLLRKIGNFRFANILILLELISLLGLIFYHNIIAVSFFMISSITILTFLSFSFDVFLENYSFDTSTGKTRGIYMTCVNLAWSISPLLTGYILTEGDYWKVFLAAIIILIPVFIILNLTLGNFKDPKYQVTNPFKTVIEVWRNKDIKNIFSAFFLLQIFYAWMTIYTPIYLHINIGLSWGSIGIIFSIMLLPFIFIQFPAGKLADTMFGEKEMLSIGFIIIALATITMFFVRGNSIVIWSLILFGTRVGAAVVEIMCDVYFFKKIDVHNANLISFYRMHRPLAYIIGPFLVILILSLPNTEMRSIFLIFGLLMFLGLKFSLSLHDTK